MARQVLPIVGAVVGAYFGGPQGAQIGYAIGSLVGNAVDPLVVKGPNIGDSRVQTSAEVIRPVYFGTACGAGNIIMAGPDIKRTVEHDQGKGGGPITTEERISKTFAIGIGDGWKGPIVGISRIWENEKLVYDTRPGTTMAAESAKFATQFTLYLGTETQMPDPGLEAIPADFGGGVGNVSAFRGLAYIVFTRKDITAWMSIPQYRFEVVTDGSASPAVQAIVLKEDPDDDHDYWLSSPNNLDWSGAWQPSVTLEGKTRYLLGAYERFCAYDVGANPVFLNADAEEWIAATGVPVSSFGGNHLGDVDPITGDIVIPQGLTGGVIRCEFGSTEFVASAGPALHTLVFAGSTLVGIDETTATLWRSVDGGIVFDDPENVSAYFNVFSGVGRFRSRDSAFLCARSNVEEDVFHPMLLETMTGASLIPHLFSYPEVDNTRFVCGAAGILEGQESLNVAITSNGRIIYRLGLIGGWVLSDYVFPVVPHSITFDGRRFLAVGSSTLGGGTGKIYTFTDPEVVTEQRSSSTVASENWWSIGALALTAGQVISGPIRLDESVERIHELSGQSLDKVDASNLATRELGGFVLAGDYSGQAALSMLASVFQFDSPEYDKQIHHRFRGQPVVRTITEDDLVDEPDEGVREDQIEFPRKLHLEAQNTASGYAPAKETSERESSDVRVVGELSVSAPIMFAGDAEAQAADQARTANILHKVAWEKARGKREFVVPDKFLTDVPGDAYQVNIRGRSDRMTIDRQNYVDGVLRLEMSYDRASAYVSNRSGNTPNEQTPPPSTIPGATSLMVLDLPALVDAEDLSTAVRHLAMGANTGSWYGAEAQEQPPSSTGYNRIARTSVGAVMGTLQAAVAQASEHYTDTTNRVRIQLSLASNSERLEGLTLSEFLSEGGAFALRNPDGDVEILQYMDVEDLGDGLIELSTLLRGRLNTGTFAFPAASRFVLLSSVVRVTTPSAYIGQDVSHRAISYGETAETSSVEVLTVQGNSAKEWPVANVLLDRAGDTINVTIVPRHRFGTELNPIRSVNWTNYLIQFRDSLDQIETVSSIAAALSFDASAMTFPVEVTVWQVNRFPWGTSEPVTEEIA